LAFRLARFVATFQSTASKERLLGGFIRAN